VLGRQFGGEGGSTEQRLSAVLAAAEQSAFNFETVGKNVIKSASATRAAGSDMAETLATNATMANLIGDTAGDRVKAFAALVSLKPDLAGKGVMGAVGALSQMDEATRRDALGGGMEVNEAYRLLLENKDSIQEMTATVRGDVAATGAGGGVLAGKIAIVEGSERFQARRDVASAQVSRTIAAENVFSAEESRFRAGQDLLRAEQIKSGSSQMFGFFGQKAGEAVRMANGSSESALTASEFIGRQDMSKVFLGPILDPLIKRSVRGFRDSFGPDSQGMDAVVEKLEGIRQNTSQAPVITGAALQSPVAAAAAP
jgi:hypothetical protein